MTIRAILISMRRRWYVVVAVVSIAALGGYYFHHADGVYSTRAVVAFMRSTNTTLLPYNGANDKSVISFAGAVAREVNSGQDPQGYAVVSAPYYGAGLRKGMQVALANDGGQWTDAFSTADIDVDVVGPSRIWVSTQQQLAISNIERTANRQQADMGIAPADRMAVSVIPATIEITQVHASRRAQTMAAVALACAALLVSGWGAVAVDQWRATTPTRRVPRTRGATRHTIMVGDVRV